MIRSLASVLMFAILAWLSFPVLSQAALILPPGFQADVVFQGVPLDMVSGIAQDQDGTLYILDNLDNPYPPNNSQLIKLDLVSGQSTVLIDGYPLKSPYDILVGDGRAMTGNDLIIADNDSPDSDDLPIGAVFRVDKISGGYSTLFIGGNSPFGFDPITIAMGPGGNFGQELYIADAGQAPWLSDSHPPFVYRLMDVGVPEMFLGPDNWTVNQQIASISFDPNLIYGNGLFVVDSGKVIGGSEPPHIWQASTDSQLSLFAQGNPGDFFMRVIFSRGGPFGQKMYLAGVIGGVAGIFTVDTQGGIQPFVTLDSIPPIEGVGLAFSQDKNSLFFGFGDTLYQIHPACIIEDQDLDGVIDQWDDCPDTPAGSYVDNRGCPKTPSASLALRNFSLIANQNEGLAPFSMQGNAILPELNLTGTPVQSRTTVEILGVLPGGGDLVIQTEDTLQVKMNDNHFQITKQ